MNQYLIDLFENENTVIIPGFGALTMVNRSTFELMFMSFMKHNDGTLESFVASIEGIDKVEAKSKIDGFVDEVNFALNNGQSYSLDGVGEFYKDGAGNIQFNPTSKVVANRDALVESIVSTPVEQPTSEEQVVSADEEQQVQEEVVELLEEPILVSEVKQDKEVEEVPTPNVVVEEPIIVESSLTTEEVKVATEEEQWQDDLDLPPLNYKPERPKKPILEKVKKDKKPKRGIGSLLIIVLALLIFGGATYVGINYKDLKEKIPFLASKEPSSFDKFQEKIGASEEEVLEKEAIALEEESIALEEEVKQLEETVDVPEVKAKEVEKPSPKVVSNGNFTVDKSLPIQVIVGSFSQEANANRMVEKLRNHGFNAAIIGTSGGLFTVSAASFNTMEEYNANVSEIKKVGIYWVRK